MDNTTGTTGTYKLPEWQVDLFLLQADNTLKEFSRDKCGTYDPHVAIGALRQTVIIAVDTFKKAKLTTTEKYYDR